MWNPFDFSGKRIIVTGATSGIGRETAISLSRQGANLCLLGRDQQKLENVMKELTGDGHQYFIKDFSIEGGYKEIFDMIVEDGKKIDGLVHSAGIATILPVQLLKKATMDESMTVNYYSFAEMVALLSKKKYHDKANVVGVSSIAVEYPHKCQGAYAATKSAMNSLVKALAIELAEKEIRINTVMPSATNTEMLRKDFETKTDDQKRDILSKQVLGLEEPEDISNVIMFLLSDAAKMITGRTVFVDGGFLKFL